MIEIAEKVDPSLALKIDQLSKSYQPRIIFNKGEHPDQLEVINNLQPTIKRNLSVDLCFFGFLFDDVTVKLCSNKGGVLLDQYPECLVSKGINEIAKRIVKFNNKVIPNSSDLLIKDTMEKFELWNSDLVY